jgi:hypothetical protein
MREECFKIIVGVTGSELDMALAYYLHRAIYFTDVNYSNLVFKSSL